MGWFSHGCPPTAVLVSVVTLQLQLLRQRHILVTQLFQWRNRAVITTASRRGHNLFRSGGGSTAIAVRQAITSRYHINASVQGSPFCFALAYCPLLRVTLTRSFLSLCPPCHCVQTLSGPEGPPARLMGVSSRRAIFSAFSPAGLTRTHTHTHGGDFLTFSFTYTRAAIV